MKDKVTGVGGGLGGGVGGVMGRERVGVRDTYSHHLERLNIFSLSKEILTCSNTTFHCVFPNSKLLKKVNLLFIYRC